MKLGRSLATVVLLSTVPAIASPHSRRGPTSPHAAARRSAKPLAHASGQRGIDGTRAAEIQTALTHAGYLAGEPTGHWDSATESAMQRYQSDNGWQTKLIPDSRAIIKLGLGPGGNGSDLASTSLPVQAP